jgi:uncharacterized glyoxalase superfamily protein PhnB
VTNVVAKPDDAPWISPYLTVKDADQAIKFYKNAFGFTVDHKEHMKDQHGKTLHVSMRHEAGVIMFAPEGAFGCQAKSPATSDTSSPVNIYVYCTDVDQL